MYILTLYMTNDDNDDNDRDIPVDLCSNIICWICLVGSGLLHYVLVILLVIK